MTLLKECVEAKRFDTRVLEKNVARGYLNEKEVEDFHKALPDDGSIADWVNLDDLAAQEVPKNGSGGYTGPEIRTLRPNPDDGDLDSDDI